MANTALVAIAPAKSNDLGIQRKQPILMPYSCVTCARRKVKCNKTKPCASCQKSSVECLYQAPQPRRRKRKLNEDGTSPPNEEPLQSSISLRYNEPETSRMGKLVAGPGKSRYIDSNLWRSLGDEAIRHMADEEGDVEEDRLVATEVSGDIASDPLTGALMGFQGNLAHFHPTPQEAMILWKTHIVNVEPICKVLHIPSTLEMVQRVSQRPAIASKDEECLLFAIYHFAVFSMTEQDCLANLGQERAQLIQKYHYSTRQALVNASFLKTTEITTMQALVLFLLPGRFSYDPHTFWILTGVAVRIGQRIGLHRDGEALGLPPFEVEIRRRLFYQLIPLDGVASQMSGTGIGILPDSWDTQRPSNVNDEHIWPGMAKPPQNQKAATEMIFCLTRSCIGSRMMKVQAQFKDYNEAELIISEVESEVEENYLRYCDIVNPLHFLTIGFARSAIIAMRIRVRLGKVRDGTVTDTEREELFQLSQRILDQDTAVSTHAGVKIYQWHVRSFFVWGSHDSLIFVLNHLCRTDLLAATETDEAWRRVEQLYNNHSELLDSKQPLQLAVRRLTLKAWEANPPASGGMEPVFITTLRSSLKRPRALRLRPNERERSASNAESKTDIESPIDLTSLHGTNTSPGTPSNGMILGLEEDFSLDDANWLFWDQLIQDYNKNG